MNIREVYGDGLKICLIVEDDEFDRMLMRRVFKQLQVDAHLHFVGTLFAARDQLETYKIDLIFLDNMLPDGRGLDFLLEIAENEILHKVPVVLVSDCPSPFMYEKAKETGQCEIWTKAQFRTPEVAMVLARAGIPHRTYRQPVH